MKKRTAHWSLVLLTSIWGFSFIVLSNGVEVFAPETLLFWRFLLAAIALLAMMFLTKNRSKLPWKEGLFASFLFTIAFFCQTQGLLYTSPSVAAFLTGLLVIFTPIFESLVIKKPPKLKVWLSSCLALFGTYLLVGGGGGAKPLGIILQLIGAIFFAAHVVYLGNKPKLDAIAFVAVQCILMSIFFGVFSVVKGTLYFSIDGLIPVLYLGLLATALGFSVQVKAQKVIPPSEASLIFSLEPVFASIFSAVILHEGITLRAIIGMVFIFAASLAVDFNFRINQKETVKQCGS